MWASEGAEEASEATECACRRKSRPCNQLRLSLYNILFYFKALLWESILLSFPAPTCIAHPGEYYCTTIGQYTTPPPTSCLYAIHHTILVITVSCKGQAATGTGRAQVGGALTLAPPKRCSYARGSSVPWAGALRSQRGARRPPQAARCRRSCAAWTSCRQTHLHSVTLHM